MDQVQSLIGGAFIAAGCLLFGWNHYNNSFMRQLQQNLEENMIEVNSNTNIADIKDNHPILVSAKVEVVDPIIDPDIGIKFNSPKVSRFVRMLQIKEMTDFNDSPHSKPIKKESKQPKFYI